MDLVYSHQSLLISTGGNGAPPSSSSAPTLMARMLEALDLQPGMRVLEIGAGTGYNAALIATITGAPYDRIIVTCGIAGLSPHWIGQLASDGLILAPIAHGGVHPIVTATGNQGVVSGKAALWADFMPAAGPLRPAELAGHNPADYIPAAPLTRIPSASPARTTAAYHDLWFFLATRDSRITRAYTDDDSVDPSKGACALHAPPQGTAWVQNDGSMSTISTAAEPTITDELRDLIHEWDTLAHPPHHCGHPTTGYGPHSL